MLSAHVLIETEVGKVGRLIVAHVQLLDGVTRTVICIVLHR
jgi:hypothetical protein